jgi:hypothetical protein
MQFATTVYHPTGTARMGADDDPLAVPPLFPLFFFPSLFPALFCPRFSHSEMPALFLFFVFVISN